MPSEPGPRLRVDVWSDLACPWCSVGKRRLEQALATMAQPDAVEVVWHSFELDPDAPVQSDRSMTELLAAKYGRRPAEAQAMLNQMTRTAAGAGLDDHFERVQPTNTFRAHQLIHLAATHGLQDAMKERLMRAYFTDGAHLGDLDTLTRLAAEVGLDADEVRRALEGHDFAPAVRADEQQARAYGITGVPFFVLGGRYGVSGAQPAEVLGRALAQVWAEQHPRPTLAPAAEGCADGSCAVPDQGS